MNSSRLVCVCVCVCVIVASHGRVRVCDRNVARPRYCRTYVRNVLGTYVRTTGSKVQPGREDRLLIVSLAGGGNDPMLLILLGSDVIVCRKRYVVGKKNLDVFVYVSRTDSCRSIRYTEEALGGPPGRSEDRHDRGCVLRRRF